MSEAATRGALRVRGRCLPWGRRTYIMGIVNVSPDSFSGDGVPDTPSADRASARTARCGVRHHRHRRRIDAARGISPIDAATELARIVPVIAGVRARDAEAIVSIDTFKADVYLRGHAAGGDLLNSIWGASDALIDACVATASPIVVMHNKGRRDLRGRRGRRSAGIARSGGRTLRARRHTARTRHSRSRASASGKRPSTISPSSTRCRASSQLGFPTLLGTSRKSTIGKLLARDVDARAFGTAATVALAAAAGIDIVRVHDVADMRDVVNVTDAIVRNWRPGNWKAGLR